ncbi:MAG: hypothetical protein ISS23_02345 [Nanoarchaeota archaeon]|nr:hypothetical protein [Nanoarchaeota archaeon]
MKKDIVKKMYRFGEWYMFNKEYDKALKSFQQVIKIDLAYNINKDLTALDQIRKCYNGLKSAGPVKANEEAQADDDLAGGLKRGFYGLPILYYQIKSSCIDDYIRDEKFADRRVGKRIEKHLKKHGKKETAKYFFLQAAGDIDKLCARWDTSRKASNRAILKKVIELDPDILESYTIIAKNYFKSRLYDRTLFYLYKLKLRNPKYYKTNQLSDLEFKVKNLMRKEVYKHDFLPDKQENMKKIRDCKENRLKNSESATCLKQKLFRRKKQNGRKRI